MAWKYGELPQAIIRRPDLLLPDLDARRPSPPDVPELLALPHRRQVVAPLLRGRMRRLLLLQRGRPHPLELPPQLGLLVLWEPRRVGGAAYGLAVGARGLVQAAVEHVGDLVLKPGHVARCHPHHGAGYDAAHVAECGVVFRPEHTHGLAGEVPALGVRQV